MLPKSSPTIANYVILQGIAIYPMQLLLAGPLFLTWVTRVSSWTKITPRQSSDAYYPATLTGINYGIVYPVPLLVFVMGLTYAPIAPIILPFCTIFFAVGYFVYKVFPSNPVPYFIRAYPKIRVSRCCCHLCCQPLSSWPLCHAINDDGSFGFTGWSRNGHFGA